MIMRNSVISSTRSSRTRRPGSRPGEAIVGSTVRRFRPIMLDCRSRHSGDDPTDAQRLLGADGGGHHGQADRRDGADDAAFLPALYAAWYQVTRKQGGLHQQVNPRFCGNMY